MRLGTRVRVTGTVGEAWGAPRLRADETRVQGSRQPAVHGLRSAPTAAVEWRLVRVAGTIVEVHRSGDRWTAELQIHGGRVPIGGLAGSGIASTDLAVGRTATIIGIVKRPYPTATDRRFAVVPRRRADVVLGKAVPTAGASSSPGAGAAAGADGTGGSPAPGGAMATGGAVEAPATDIDLRDLGAHAGERVRVGGLVAAIEADGIRLDDGTAEALIILGGDAAGLAGSLQVGDALNATGTPEVRDEPVLVVDDASGIELVGDLGAPDPPDAGPSAEAASIANGDMPSAAPVRAAFASGPGLDSMSTGLGTLVLVGFASVAATLARRERGRRRVRARDRRPTRGHGTERSGDARRGGTGRSEPELGPRSDLRSGPRSDPRCARSGRNRGLNLAQTCVDRLDAAGIRPLCSNGGARQTSVTEHGERAFAERGYPGRGPYRRPAVPHRPRPRRAGRLHPPPRRPGSRRSRRRPFRLRRAPATGIASSRPRPGCTRACGCPASRPGSGRTTSRS